jgi:hypothetical protein
VAAFDVDFPFAFYVDQTQLISELAQARRRRRTATVAASGSSGRRPPEMISASGGRL